MRMGVLPVLTCVAGGATPPAIEHASLTVSPSASQLVPGLVQLSSGVRLR